jgi:hypothetical protein
MRFLVSLGTSSANSHAPPRLPRSARNDNKKGTPSFCSAALQGRAHEAKASHYISKPLCHCEAHAPSVVARHTSAEAISELKSQCRNYQTSDYPTLAGASHTRRETARNEPTP